MKSALSFAIIIILMLSLAACTGRQNTTEPTEAPALPTEASTEAPTEEPQVTETPAPEAFVPEGYDAHDYLALAEFFGTVIPEFDCTIGEMCYSDYKGEFDIEDPSTWHTDYHGVYWDKDGKVTEISFYPPTDSLPASLELIGFEKLKDVKIWYVQLESITIEDCPMLDNGSMVYTGVAEGEASIKAGYVATLNVESRSYVYCSLMGDENPFVIGLTSSGNGIVRVLAAEDEGEYVVTVNAIADEYVDFIGWYDEDGKLVSEEASMHLSGGELGSISGAYSYYAQFALPPAPTPLPDGDYFCEIKPNVPSNIDIDGDGQDDTVLVEAKSGADDGSCISVIITLAADPDTAYEYDGGEGHTIFAAAADMGTGDGRKALLISYDQCDGDPITYAFRLKDEGGGFDVFTEPIGIYTGVWYGDGLPESFIYSAEEGVPFERRTEILGTNFVLNHFTVTAEGIEFLDEEFMYIYPHEYTLKKELTVTLDSGKTKTLPVGAKIKAYSTDRKSFVKVKLEDGGIGRVEVSFGNTEYDYPVLLNGINQDEYVEIMYED